MKSEKKCGDETCGCNSSQVKQDEQLVDLTSVVVTNESKKDETKDDPTKFGDWQVKGRAIDF